MADELIAWALDHGLQGEYNERRNARKELRFRASDERRSSVFSIHAQQGDLLVQERWLMYADPFRQTPEGPELQARLERFVTGWFREPSPHKFPNIYLAQLRNPEMRQALLTELEWIVARL